MHWRCDDFSSVDGLHERLELFGVEKTDAIKISCSMDKCFV